VAKTKGAEASKKTEGPAARSGGFSGDAQVGQPVDTDFNKMGKAGGGMSALGFLASNKAGNDPAKEKRNNALNQAAEKLKAANGDSTGRIIGEGRWGSHLDDLKDPLAKAVYEYADYGNFGASSGIYGPTTRGDVQSGGLGRGFTIGPEHYTASKHVMEGDLDKGVADIKKHLDGVVKPDGLDKELDGILAAGQKNGTLTGSPGEQKEAVHHAAQNVLDHIQDQAGKKEIRLGKDHAPLTHGELLSSLEPGTLEHTIAKQIVQGDGADGSSKEQWMDFYKRGISYTGKDEAKLEKGLVGPMLQQYVLGVSKRAKEGEILGRIQSHLE
jgi:hypothetical protein